MEVDSAWLPLHDGPLTITAAAASGWSSADDSSSFHFDESDDASSSGASTHDTSDDTHDHSNDWRVSPLSPFLCVHCSFHLCTDESSESSRAAFRHKQHTYSNLVLTLFLNCLRRAHALCIADIVYPVLFKVLDHRRLGYHSRPLPL